VGACVRGSRGASNWPHRTTPSQAALLLLDEPAPTLSVSVQAQVLSLLDDLQRRLGLTYFFISHDLAVIRYVCDRVALIHHGRIVEQGSRDAIFDTPQTDYTRRMLLAAMPEVGVG
jgi:ABC-type microcin C transport system duplicated ATPase subunit YejF